MSSRADEVRRRAELARNTMPRIAELYGIAIYMYFSDRGPPNFHAIYGRFDAEIEIATGDIVNGKLPSRARRLVETWGREYQRELEHNWDRARAHQALLSVPPLEY